jgi:N-methylhydantoinase A/oxoprolinase/acetone carboxylase beta subunit
MPKRTFFAGIDIGGTFTDLVMFQECPIWLTMLLKPT